jgi:hypothetical protein
MAVGGVGLDRGIGGDLVASHAQHLAREVGAEDPRAGDATRDLQRAVQGSRAQVQDARSLAGAVDVQPFRQPANRLPAPQHIDARRHDPVGRVVTTRHAVEHPADIGALGGQAGHLALLPHQSPSSFQIAST